MSRDFRFSSLTTSHSSLTLHSSTSHSASSAWLWWLSTQNISHTQTHTHTHSLCVSVLTLGHCLFPGLGATRRTSTPTIAASWRCRPSRPLTADPQRPLTVAHRAGGEAPLRFESCSLPRRHFNQHTSAQNSIQQVAKRTWLESCSIVWSQRPFPDLSSRGDPASDVFIRLSAADTESVSPGEKPEVSFRRKTVSIEDVLSLTLNQSVLMKIFFIFNAVSKLVFLETGIKMTQWDPGWRFLPVGPGLNH